MSSEHLVSSLLPALLLSLVHLLLQASHASESAEIQCTELHDHTKLMQGGGSSSFVCRWDCSALLLTMLLWRVGTCRLVVLASSQLVLACCQVKQEQGLSAAS